MVFSYRLDDAPIENRNFCLRDRCSFREREKKRHDSRGDGSCSCRLCDVFFFVFLFFCPPVFFTTKVNVTNGQRSIGPNDLVLSETRVLSPRCEDRNPADGEIAGTGWSKVETFEGNG